MIGDVEMEPEFKDRLKKVLTALREAQIPFRVAHSEMNMLRRAMEYGAYGRTADKIWEDLEDARANIKASIHTIEELIK